MITYGRNLLLVDSTLLSSFVFSVYRSIVSHDSQQTASLTSGSNSGAKKSLFLLMLAVPS